MYEKNNIITPKALCLVLLLLLMMGVSGAWGQTVYYEQDYEETVPITDWTTNVGGRFTPIIVTDGGNYYLAADPAQTFNNGATLTGPNLGVEAGANFFMTFDLRLGNSNSNKPEFYICDASGNKFFSLTPQNPNGNNWIWIINGDTEHPIVLDGTQYLNRGDFNIDETDSRPWYRFKFIHKSSNTTLTITNLSTSTDVITNWTLPVLSASGGLGQMMYTSGKSLAKFAIDNVLVTQLFSYNSATAEADITWVGNYGHHAISGLPTIIDETGSGESITYSSTNESVARHDGGSVYLVGVGTTNIVATKGTNSTSYELTVYGTSANTTSGHTDSGDLRTSTWTIHSTGILEKGAKVHLGGISMTYGSAGETAVVVDDNGTKVLKTIDSNGYSWINTEPPTTGTHYKFFTTKAGHLILNGKFTRPRFYVSDNGTPLYSNDNEGVTTPIELDLEANKTYYFYAHVKRDAPVVYPSPGMLSSFSYTYNLPKLEWSTNSVTVDIMDMGNHNPNAFTTALGKPTLTNNGGYAIRQNEEYTNPDDGKTYYRGYRSSDPTVAVIRSWFGQGEINICGIGTTTITALDEGGNTASYTLTVTGNSVAHQIQGNTMTFIDEGVLVNSGDKQAKQAVLSSGLTIDYGYGSATQGETAIVTNYGMGAVLKMIDDNGYSHTNRQNGNNPDVNLLPWQTAAGGTFVKLTTGANSGYLIVTGNVSAERTVLYKDNNVPGSVDTQENRNNATLVGGYNGETPVGDTEIDGNTFSVSLEANSVYFLYNKRITEDIYNNIYVPLVHSITFVPGFFSNAYEITSLANASTYTIQTVKGFSSPTYTIEQTVGNVGSPTISGDKITGIAGGGAIRIRATQGTDQAEYILTVAYPAADGKVWNFNPSGLLNTSRGLQDWPEPPNYPNPSASPKRTTTDADGGGWTAFWKNANEGFLRGEEWGHNAAVHGDNAIFVPETAGLVFNTVEQGFYLRNNERDYQNIGIRKHGASFTIPCLQEGDIVELNWKHETGESGSNFVATNLTDLRGKPISEVESFQITESAYRTKDSHPGRYSFIATGGDVTFTLKDNGNCDILSIRIYKGPYQSTMRNINLRSGAEATGENGVLLLDNALDGYTYNYCNPLNSTATGPAFYVLKGYRAKTSDGQTEGIDYDAPECVQGTDAGRHFVGGNPDYPLYLDENAYPISEEEKDALYEQRKNLVGFRMYNQPWQSRNNAYNDGRIEAVSGWGKVTIRMNNYTNDMKYLIGYTNDYTLTIGSAPHQKYPYTWDFTNISAQRAKGASTNVFNAINDDEVNWTNNGENNFTLKTDNAGQSGSQYVPGAVLVSTDKALSKYTVDEGKTAVYALDEVDGLGVDGQVTLQANTSTSRRPSTSIPPFGTAMKCVTETTITIPDLNAEGKQDWLYVSASQAPTTVINDGDELLPVTDAQDGPDANTANDVYKYKIINQGNAYITFSAGTDIYKIGVTHILKEIYPVGGQGWATESRDHDIDHSLTGYFTVNDVNAYIVPYPTYETHKAVVSLNAVDENGYIPNQTGLVLKLDEADKANLASNFNKANNKTVDGEKHWYVPLFYPSYTALQSTTPISFLVTNFMVPPDKINEDIILDTESHSGYTHFILAKRYMTWKKTTVTEGETLISQVIEKPSGTTFESREAAVFYRLHFYTPAKDGITQEQADELNTIGPNKAFLLLHTDQLPPALWQESGGSSPRRYIAIEGVSDMEELELLEEAEREANRGDGRIYNLNGQVVGGDEKTLPAGIYIRNGKKLMLR